jgi:3-methyladenine DNA glycosylase AlkD
VNANADANATELLLQLRHAPIVNSATLRALAKPHRRDHALARALWDTDDPHARMIASMVADPVACDDALLEGWVRDIDSWFLCDCCAFELFRKLPGACERCSLWAARPEAFVKRAAFATLAGLALSDRTASDERFRGLLPTIEREASDPRPYVKKSVNWALRQIGKRNQTLNRAAMEAARRLSGSSNQTARWVGSDALRELESVAVQRRLRGRAVSP